MAAALGLLLVGCGSGSKRHDGGGDFTSTLGDFVSRTDGQNPAVAVTLKNLSAKLLKKYSVNLKCSGSGCALGAGGDYQLSFVLENHAASAMRRLDSFSIALPPWKIGGSLTPDDFCTEPPWRLDMKQTSKVIDVDFGTLGVASEIALTHLRAVLPCRPEGNQCVVEAGCDSSGSFPPAPYAGTVTLELAGLLDDATPWTAKATAELQDVSQ